MFVPCVFETFMMNAMLKPHSSSQENKIYEEKKKKFFEGGNKREHDKFWTDQRVYPQRL